MIAIAVAGVAVRGPGVAGWDEAAAVLRGERAFAWTETEVPAGGPLTAGERRRASQLTRLVVFTAAEAAAAAGADPAQLPAVFASSSGDLAIIDRIGRVLVDGDRLVSPTDFQNSVHNAAAGYWSIATGCTRPSLSISAFDHSFAAGLVEAVSWLEAESGDLLLIAYDAAAPEPLKTARPILGACAVAMVLRPARAEIVDATLALSSAPHAPETTLDDPALERLRAGNPAARSFPLLRALATRTACDVVLAMTPALKVCVTWPR